jgi:mitochondrial fission protein ELM1
LAAQSSSRQLTASPDLLAPGRVWLLLGDKPGDNAQVEAVVAALGWCCERKMLHWRAPYAIEKPRFRATLDHVDRHRSGPLEPPWPDLILTIGRRPSMVGLWIKERSAGRTRIVLFGKPSGLMDRFDLVVAGGEVQLPPLANVLPIQLPLMRAPAADLEAAVVQWQPRLASLPRPLIALLVGGPTIPFAFDARVTERLCALAAEIAGTGGGAPSRLVAAAACRAGLLDATRDFRAFHQMLLERGLAVRAGEPLAPPTGAVPDDLTAVVARVKALIAAPSAPSPRHVAG